MQKGFIHVLEAILVSLIMIVSVPFFLGGGGAERGWDSVKLKYTSEDLLATMDRMGFEGGESDLQEVMERSAATLENDIFTITQRSGIGYSVKSMWAAKNEVRVGCNCTAEERFVLERALGLVNANDRHIVFRVFPFQYSDLSFLDFDVILIDGDADLTLLEDFYSASPANKNIIRNHLSKGHGIVEYVDLTASDLDASARNDVQREVFGLASGDPSSGTIAFTNKFDPLSDNYYIAKYFGGVGMTLNFTDNITQPLVIGGFNFNTTFDEASPVIDIDMNGDGIYGPGELDLTEGTAFSITADGLVHNFSIDEIDLPRYLVQFNALDGFDYQFHDFSDDPAVPSSNASTRIVTGGTGSGLIINATGGGRAAWMSRGTGDDEEGLLRTTVLWAAGEDWDNIIRTISSQQSGSSYTVSQGEEFYEPYMVEMVNWNLF